MGLEIPEALFETEFIGPGGRGQAKTWKALVMREKDRFLEDFLRFAMENWEEIVEEMSAREQADILDHVPAAENGGPGDEIEDSFRALLPNPPEVLKVLLISLRKEGRAAVLEVAAGRLAAEMVAGAAEGRWAADKWRGRFGEQIVTYFLKHFPLTKELAYLRADAAYRLGFVEQREVLSLLNRMHHMRDRSARAAAEVQTLKADLRREREARAELKEKLRLAKKEIERLSNMLEAAKANSGGGENDELTRRIRELKAVIKEKNDTIAKLKG